VLTSQWGPHLNKRTWETHNLELDGNDTEVENLHCRPEHKVGLQGRQVDITELVCQCSSTTTLGNRHVGEEARQT